MSEKKYEICKDKTIVINGITLYQIRALRDFSYGDRDARIHHIRKGTIGGYIEREWNLSQSGGCWISDDSYVYGNARVIDDAQVCENSRVSDHALVEKSATVKRSTISNWSVIRGGAIVDNAFVGDKTIIGGLAKVEGDFTNAALICGDAYINPSARVYISGNFNIRGTISIE